MSQPFSFSLRNSLQSRVLSLSLAALLSAPALYAEVGETVSYDLKVTDAGWATVCVPFDFTVPEGMQVFTISGIGGANDDEVIIHNVTSPQAHKPYVVKAAKGTYAISGIEQDLGSMPRYELPNGVLIGSYQDTYVPSKSYIMQQHGSEVGFYYVANGLTNILHANHAYMKLPEGSHASLRPLGIEGTASTDFDDKLQAEGIDPAACTDLSANAEPSLEVTSFALANITSADGLPNAESGALRATMQFFDGNGRTMTKNILLDLQGSGNQPKVNLSVEFCEDQWVGDETTDVTFGQWVTQDEFHLKALYEDGLRGTTEVAYQLYSTITERQGCYPQAFPVMLYVNGDFYGLMAWQLKKHRKNMNLAKDESSNVWVDGTLNDKQLFGGNINWTKFEVRNPKDLYNMDGSDYDGDDPQELIDETSAAWTGKKKMVRCAEAKQHIIELSQYNTELTALQESGATTAEMRAAIEARYDVREMINYMIFSLVSNNYDGFSKNWQWFTYDGQVWTVAPYNCELTFGYNDDTDNGYKLWPAEKGSKKYDYRLENVDSNGPMYWIKNYYWDDLQQRYAALCQAGIIDKDAIVARFAQWTANVCERNYQAEWNRWPESPVQLGANETLERVSLWVSERISLLDAYLGNTSSISQLRANADAPVAIYSLDGRTLSAPAQGLSIVRHADGGTQLVFRK